MRRLWGYCKGMALIVLMHFIERTWEARMERRDRSWVRWWLIAAMLIVVARLLSGCAHVPVMVAPTPEAPEVIVEAEFPPCSLIRPCTIAQVVCNKAPPFQPVIMIRPGIDTTETPFTLVHERAHVQQMQKDCAGIRILYHAEPSVRWRMELEAYCAEAGARIKAGATTGEVISRLVEMLQYLYQANEEDVVCPWIHRPP